MLKLERPLDSFNDSSTERSLTCDNHAESECCVSCCDRYCPRGPNSSDNRRDCCVNEQRAKQTLSDDSSDATAYASSLEEDTIPLRFHSLANVTVVRAKGPYREAQ